MKFQSTLVGECEMPGWQFHHVGVNNHTATSTVRTMTAAGLKKNTTRMMMSGISGTTSIDPTTPEIKRNRIMSPEEFFYKVVDLRMAQKTYFKTRDPHDLRIARKVEGDIDREIDRVRGLLAARENQIEASQ